MAGSTNYGSTFTFNGATIGKCIVLSFPEVATEEAETTNHASGGYGESIPNGLVRVGDIELEFLNEAGVYSALRTYMTNKTVAAASLSNGVDTISGSAWIKSVQPNEADSTGPEANKLAVTVACTGAWT